MDNQTHLILAKMLAGSKDFDLAKYKAQPEVHMIPAIQGWSLDSFYAWQSFLVYSEEWTEAFHASLDDTGTNDLEAVESFLTTIAQVQDWTMTPPYDQECDGDLYSVDSTRYWEDGNQMNRHAHYVRFHVEEQDQWFMALAFDDPGYMGGLHRTGEWVFFEDHSDDSSGVWYLRNNLNAYCQVPHLVRESERSASLCGDEWVGGEHDRRFTGALNRAHSTVPDNEVTPNTDSHHIYWTNRGMTYLGYPVTLYLPDIP